MSASEQRRSLKTGGWLTQLFSEGVVNRSPTKLSGVEIAESTAGRRERHLLHGLLQGVSEWDQRLPVPGLRIGREQDPHLRPCDE